MTAHANTAEKLKEAIALPEEVYDTPADVTADDALTVDQKIDVLESWKSNEQALLRASGEGMAGGENSNLQLVVNELEKLEDHIPSEQP